MPSTRLSVLGARAATQHSSLVLQPSCQGRYARQPHDGQQSRYCVSTSTPKDDTPEDWASTLAAIVVSENALAELGPMKLSLTLQSCTRSQYFRSQSGWPTVDKAFSAVAACLVVPANLQKFNSQDLVLTLKAIERFMKERSHRQRRKEHRMSSESSPVLPQDHSIEACSNILSSLRGKLSYRTPLREFGMTLSSIVSIEPLRNNEITKDIIAHILACIKEGHRNRSLVSSSAKLGEEAFGQGLANVAMALAKLRFEDAAFMNILADIVGDSVERLSLIDIGQISFAFGKLHIESSDAVFAMFGHIAERVADEEESLSKHLPTACSLLYAMHRLGLECPEFSNMVAAILLPAVDLLDGNQLLLILPACRRLSGPGQDSSEGSNVSCGRLYRSAGRAFAKRAPLLPVGILIQGCASIHPSDLEDIAQQLRHRGNATWVYHARYGVSIILALFRNIMEAEGQQTNPGPETTELIREICRHFVKDPRLMSELTADHREALRTLPPLSCFPGLEGLKSALPANTTD